MLCDHVVRYAVPTIVRASLLLYYSLCILSSSIGSIGVFLLNSIEALSFRFYMDSFFWVLYGLFLLDLYVLFLLGSIWALSFGFYEGSFIWIL